MNRCKCKNIFPGDYKRQTSMKTFWSHEWVCIDTCLVQEIAELWYHGIRTIECCCGHNGNSKPYIAVDPKFIPTMKALHYLPQGNGPEFFLPKGVRG